jgi:hypothetical protein
MKTSDNSEWRMESVLCRFTSKGKTVGLCYLYILECYVLSGRELMMIFLE